MSRAKFINKNLFSWILKACFIGIAFSARVTSEDKVETPSSGRFCISDCSTCPVICSPPPPMLITTSHPPPPSPHSPSSLPYLSPPPKSESPSHSSGNSPPPPPPSPPPTPLKPYNTPPSGLAQPQPTVISAPHDFSYPYYYFYAAGASSLSIHAPFFVLLFLTMYSIVGNQ